MKKEDVMIAEAVWHNVSTPILPSEAIPPERKVVLVWLNGSSLPFCGYIRYAFDVPSSPYFVVYWVSIGIKPKVIAWCDCLPDKGPDNPWAALYSAERATGRGLSARTGK